MKIDILGIKIDRVNLAEVVKNIYNWLEESDQKFIATANPEFIVATQRSKKFADVLAEADLVTCDGVGLVWAAKFLRKKKLQRVTGVDLVEKIITDRIGKTFLLGSNEATLEAMSAKYPDSLIVGKVSGGKINKQTFRLEDNQKVIDTIKESGAQILLVAFGQVSQENWIRNNLPLIPNIKVAIGVGGTFDYLSGKIKRAPKWLQTIGLEWLFRLLRQPRRLIRVIDATIIFSLIVLVEKVKLIFKDKQN